MYTTAVNKTVIDPETGEEILYYFSASDATETGAEYLALLYVSMVEYGMDAAAWTPGDMAFAKEQLYQFIQPNTLEMIEQMYPNAVETAYGNAMAYVQSYIGAMFDVDAMLESGDTSSTALTLRLALCICTVTFILASSPQYADTIEIHNKQLHTLLRGLKQGSRNFGKAAIVGEPNVRAQIVRLGNSNGLKP